MNNIMTLLDAMQQLAETKKAIEAKYNSIIKKIDDYTKNIDDLILQKESIQNTYDKNQKRTN